MRLRKARQWSVGFCILCASLGLGMAGTGPVWASISSDIHNGMPLPDVIQQALASHTPYAKIVEEAVQAGAYLGEVVSILTQKCVQGHQNQEAEARRIVHAAMRAAEKLGIPVQNATQLVVQASIQGAVAGGMNQNSATTVVVTQAVVTAVSLGASQEQAAQAAASGALAAGASQASVDEAISESDKATEIVSRTIEPIQPNVPPTEPVEPISQSE